MSLIANPTRIPETLYSGHVIVVANIRNQAITANTNILSINLKPTFTPSAFIIFYGAFSATGSLVIKRTYTDLGSTVTEVLNEGFPFAADAAYSFSFPLDRNETLNLQYSQNATVNKMVLYESQVM
jgi:hypothetical protein